MNDETQPAMPANRARGTSTFTHKQLGVTGGVIAAIALVTQMKGMFVPVEKSAAQDQQIAQLQNTVISMKDEFGHKIERSNDKIIDRIDKLEERLTKGQDKLEARVNMLETMHLNVKSKTTN